MRWATTRVFRPYAFDPNRAKALLAEGRLFRMGSRSSSTAFHRQHRRITASRPRRSSATLQKAGAEGEAERLRVLLLSDRAGCKTRPAPLFIYSIGNSYLEPLLGAPLG